LGEFQSDELEGEFGIYRSNSGGCYYISVEQLLYSARFRRMQVYCQLSEVVELPSHTLASCCASTLSDNEVHLIDSCPEGVERITMEEHGAIYYICGYISKKEGIPSHDEFPYTEHSQFTELVSRGLLIHPQKWLFIFAQFCYAYFEVCDIKCVNRLCSVFTLIHDAFFDISVDATSLASISRRLGNCFMKGIVRRDTENQFIAVQDTNTRCLRKLQSASTSSN
jgi:hypothetical protein